MVSDEAEGQRLAHVTLTICRPLRLLAIMSALDWPAVDVRVHLGATVTHVEMGERNSEVVKSENPVNDELQTATR